MTTPKNTWTFYSISGTKKYTVSEPVAALSKMFKTMIENAENEKAVQLQVIQQVIEGTDEKFEINTDRMLEYIYQYFKIWETNPELADYVPVGPVQTSEFSHVLQDKDIEFIEHYLSREMPDYKGTESQIRRKKIETIGKLACQADGFLEIDSLAHKLYAYVAVLIWNTSIVDFSEALRDPEFKKIQYAAIEQWEKDNDNKFAAYARDNKDILYDVTLPTDRKEEDDFDETDDFDESGPNNEDVDEPDNADPDKDDSDQNDEDGDDPDSHSESDQESDVDG